MVVTCLQNHALVVPTLIYLNEASQLKIVEKSAKDARQFELE